MQSASAVDSRLHDTLKYSEKAVSRQSKNVFGSPSKHSEMTMQSNDRSLQLRITDERLAKLEKMYQELS